MSCPKDALLTCIKCPWRVNLYQWGCMSLLPIASLSNPDPHDMDYPRNPSHVHERSLYLHHALKSLFLPLGLCVSCPNCIFPAYCGSPQQPMSCPRMLSLLPSDNALLRRPCLFQSCISVDPVACLPHWFSFNDCSLWHAKMNYVHSMPMQVPHITYPSSIQVYRETYFKTNKRFYIVNFTGIKHGLMKRGLTTLFRSIKSHLPDQYHPGIRWIDCGLTGISHLRCFCYWE